MLNKFGARLLMCALLLALIATNANAQMLLSQAKPVMSSSSQEGVLSATRAVDGEPATRWSSNFSDTEWIYIDLGTLATIERVVLNWEAAYGRAYQIEVSDNAAVWTSIFSTATGDGGVDDLSLSGVGRYVRMKGITRATSYGYSLWEFEVYGTPLSLVSEGALATSSSHEANLVAANAVDGNTYSRWSSNFTDTEWIAIDLGAVTTIKRISLNWEGAFGRAYQIEVSDNGSNWTTVYSTNTADGGFDDFNVNAAGRYVRMNGLARGTVYGYSLWEFQVYGTSVPATGIVSHYFANDVEAQALWNGERTVTMPAFNSVEDLGLQWRVINALRALGYEAPAITGRVIDAAAFKTIDQRLAIREKLFDDDAARLPNFQDIWAPQFRDNLPQTFGVHVMVRVLELFNQGSRQYQTIDNQCLLANIVPAMCGTLVDMGTTDGTACSGSSPLREQQIIQMPEFYSFSNVRRQISADELPEVGVPIASTCQYAATLVHEFTHDIDNFWRATYMDKQFNRAQACGTEYMHFDKPGSPFMQSVTAGSQNLAEYVSGYAAGVINAGNDYRVWEDVAESVTAYIVFPEYFRTRASANLKLQARYDYIKTEIFGGVEFRNLALDSQSFSPPNAGTMVGLCLEAEEFRMDDIVVK